MRDEETPDELLNDLLHHEGAAGAGEYNSYDRWSASLNPGGSISSPGARLITVHEAVHVVLNDTTAYGVLLAATAAMAQTGDERAQAALPRLVGYSRGLHEAFATFQSVWLAVDGDVSYLRDYPRYQRWYADAADLVPWPDHSRGKEMMIEAAVRACMQAPVLDPLVADQPDWERLWTPPARYRPDHRFGLLHQATDAGFWAAAWDECRSTVHDPGFWTAIDEVDRDPTSRAGTYVDTLSEPLAACAHVLYGHVARLLRELDTATLEYDGHRDHLGEVVHAVEQTSPAAAGMLIPSQDSRTVREEAFEMWGRERLVVREGPRPVVVHRFADILAESRISSVLSGGSGNVHVFGAVRQARRMLDQFAMPEDDQRRFREFGSEPVLVLRSEDEAGRLELTVVEEPAELSGLAQALPSGVRAHVNVSLACLGDAPWRDRFARALVRTRVSGLVDLSLMAQFDLWRRQGSSLAYAQATVADIDGDPAELLVCLVDDSNLPLLLVCTSVTSDVLQRYIEHSYPEAVAEPAVITSRQDDIQLAVSHLLREEYYFDMAAHT